MAVENSQKLETLFSDPLARRIWDHYFRRVKFFSKSISPESQQELKLEIQDHLYESFSRETGGSEADRLLNAIDKIGDPEEYITPMVAERLLVDASQTYNPKTIVRGLYYYIRGGVKHVFFSLLFLIGYGVAFMIGLFTILKILFPNYVGVFLHKSGEYSYGFDANQTNAAEVLGYWLIPLGVGLAVLIYMGLTRLLRVLKRRHIQEKE